VDVNLEYEKVIYENDVFGNVTQQTLRLTVPKGVRSLESVTIPNAGNVSADGICGDLIITIVLQPHAVFSTVTLPIPSGSGIPATASPLDIVLHKTISLKDSLCGFQFDFAHLNGKSYQILNRNVGSVIQPESVKTIKGLGFERAIESDSNGGVECGSLHIFFHVVYPESISEDLQTALSNLLP
jgi:DnaJ-class molecular chaperone